MITIHNLRNSKQIEVNEIRVDRKSILGNPFKLINKNNDVERTKVCEQYEEYFNAIVHNKSSYLQSHNISESTCKKFISELNFLRNILHKYNELKLYCWCYPKRCHAETIKLFIEY